MSFNSLSLVCCDMKLFDMTITISWSFYCIKVGTIAANGDRKIGEVVAKSMGRFGNERIFIVSVSCLLNYLFEKNVETLPLSLKSNRKPSQVLKPIERINSLKEKSIFLTALTLKI